MRPAWVPESAWDAKTGVNLEAFGKHYRESIVPKLQEAAAEHARRASLPQKADDYKVVTTETFRPPEGVDFKLDEADPLWPQAREWAHKHGLNQAAFAEAVDLVAARSTRDAHIFVAARNAEVGKLGANANARIDAAASWWEASTGDAVFGAIIRRAPVANIIAGLEKVIAKMTAQGHVVARRASEGNDIPGYDNMTYEQRRFAQDQAAARRR